MSKVEGARQERLTAETLQADAADADNVGKEQSRVGNGLDGVEGGFGAEVDGAKSEGDNETEEE